MSLAAPDLTRRRPRPRDLADSDDAIVVTCGACGTRQHASGRALGYTCDTCGSEWRVLRCRSCRTASVVLAGVSACPRCGHDHHTRPRAAPRRQPSWLTEPDPLSVWIGGVKYLGGHAERDDPVSSAGLLLDRRGIHVRAFAELLSIRWDTVTGIDIEGPQDISERLTIGTVVSLGASTWALQVAYLTVHTAQGDAIFEVDGLGPPALHARLSRVLQGLQRAEPSSAPITIERPTPPAPAALEAPTPAPAPAPAPAPTPVPVSHQPIAIDAERSDAPLEVLVIDALWKLAQLRESGLLSEYEVATMRAQLLARYPIASDAPAANELGRGTGPLLHV